MPFAHANAPKSRRKLSRSNGNASTSSRQKAPSISDASPIYEQPGARFKCSSGLCKPTFSNCQATMILTSRNVIQCSTATFYFGVALLLLLSRGKRTIIIITYNLNYFTFSKHLSFQYETFHDSYYWLIFAMILCIIWEDQVLVTIKAVVDGLKRLFYCSIHFGFESVGAKICIINHLSH